MRIFSRPVYKTEIQIAEGLSDSASGSTFSRIGGGVAVPIVLAHYGLKACFTQAATFPGHRAQSLALSGTPAITFGVALLGIALFLHVHFVWTTSARLFRWAELGKIVSLLVFLAFFAYTGWRILA